MAQQEFHNLGLHDSHDAAQLPRWGAVCLILLVCPDPHALAQFRLGTDSALDFSLSFHWPLSRSAPWTASPSPDATLAS